MGASRTISKAMWKLLGAFWEAYRPPLERLGSFWGRLQSVFEASWDVLGTFWDVLEAFWGHFGSIPRHFGKYFNAWEASSMHFTKILKNLEKHCKVLQKSMCGGSEISEKHSSDSLWASKLRSSSAWDLKNSSLGRPWASKLAPRNALGL